MAKCLCGKEVGCSCKLLDGKYCSQTCKDKHESKSNNLSELSKSEISTLSDKQLSVSPN